MFESFFLFDQKYYKLCHGVAMGSQLVHTLANVFMCYFEKICPEIVGFSLNRLKYKIYVNNTFLLFRSTEHVGKCKKYLNKRHKNIAFTTEIEKDGSP